MTEHARKTAAAVMRAVDAAIAGEPSKYPILRALADHEAAITAPIKARAEAAEARVAELRSFIENWSAVAGFPDAETYVKAFKEASANYLARVCAPTTEAVTEVEGS